MSDVVTQNPVLSNASLSDQLQISFTDRLKAFSLNTFSMLIVIPIYLGFVAAMRYRGKYVISDIEKVRAAYKEAAKTKSPLIICSNHLTFIDSALITWAMGSLPWYLRNFKRFSWNLPAGDVFKKNLFYAFIGYSAKCLFIHRDGTKEHKDSVLSICKHLLKSGEVVTIFPEGRRSRSGVFEAGTMRHGVGKLVAELGPSKILCVYLRSDKQKTYSNFPPIGSVFHVGTKLISITAPSKDKEGYSAVLDTVSQTIQQLERSYFSAHPVAPEVQ